MCLQKQLHPTKRTNGREMVASPTGFEPNQGNFTNRLMARDFRFQLTDNSLLCVQLVVPWSRLESS